MRIAICDDDKLFMETLEHKLRAYPFVSRVQQYTRVDSFIAELEECGGFDLVLLDLDLGEECTGIEYAEKLYGIAPHLPVIYITGFNDRFSQYILLKDVNLAGYLTKPVEDTLLEQYLQKVLSRRAVETYFSFQQQGRAYAVNMRQIIYIESKNHISVIHTDTVSYTVYEKLSDLLLRLPETFVQCHKSYIVNMHWIQRLEQRKILLQNGETVWVSRSCGARTREAVLRFMGLQV